MGAHKISGEWRGRYQYNHSPIPNRGCGFTAFVYERNAGSIDGTIVDDADLPTASFEGSFSFPSVEFVKMYSKSGTYSEVEKQGNKNFHIVGTYGPPVEYVGSMSEDGKSMSGTWSILGVKDPNTGKTLASMGTWIAYRVDEEESKKEENTGTEKVRETEDQLT